MKPLKVNRKLAVLSLLALGGTAGAAVTQCTAIYTSNYDSSNVGNISAINMQTGAPMFTLASNQTSPNAVGLNPSDGYVYWVDQTVNAQGILFPQYSSKVYREKADGTGSVQQVGVISKGSNNADIIGGTFDARR